MGGEAALQPSLRPARRSSRGLVDGAAPSAAARSAAGSACASSGRRRSAARSRPCAASASGRSANSAAISARRLETVLRRQPAAVGLGDEPALGDADQRVVRLVILARREERLVGRRPAAGRGHRRDRSAPARRASAPACRGAAARHRAGRRTVRCSRAQRRRREFRLPAGDGRSSGPPGPPVSAIRPSVAPARAVERDVRLLVRRRLQEGAPR